MSKSRYKSAIGLRYTGGSHEVPTLSINGENLLADEVVKIAKRYGVPVVERPELAEALKLIEQDSAIPEHLFEAVAAVLNEIEQHCNTPRK